MTEHRIDYDEIAPGYDGRFVLDRSPLRVKALRGLGQRLRAHRILEVGCGTAYWLAQLDAGSPELHGLDASAGMLRQAQRRGARTNLVRGHARDLAYKSGSFDLVFCVNALHHFEQPRSFIHEASRILRAGGVLAIMGSDPHGQRGSWYVYDYFEGTYQRDLGRFPGWENVRAWIAEAGFERVALEAIERIYDPKHGRRVLEDPFLRKNACSQLALLTDEAYEAGLRRIEAALEAAEAASEDLVFRTDLSIAMLTGHKP
jgi:ubiquinone/menaquinone biosynthesis C-methylase UbiE